MHQIRGAPLQTDRRRCGTLRRVTTYRIAEAADLLGVSDDTVRRWVDNGRLARAAPATGPTRIDGVALAALAASLADQPDRERTRAARSVPATGCTASSPRSARTP